MFDMGFTELVLIGIVGLVVIGPERLPGVARTAGKYFGKLRRFMSNVKADVESELRADELRDILSKQSDELESLKKVVDEVGKDVGNSVNQVQEAVKESPSDENSTDSWTESISPPQEEAPAVEADPVKPKPKPKAARRKSVKKAAKPKAKKAVSK